MGFSNAARTAINANIFLGTALPWDANTDLWIALYSADPGASGTATTNEATWTNYARVPLDRATEFGAATNTIDNDVLVQFPICGVTGQTVTHVGIVDTASGAGNLIISGALAASQAIASGNQPQFNLGNLVVTLT
jgi:hypothetical protein